MVKDSEKGISLFELLVVLSIMSLLSSLAYPGYVQYMIKAKRLEGRCALLELGSRMEQYTIQNPMGYTEASLEKLNMPEKTEHGYYQLSIQSADATHYSIIAVPTFKDPVCTQLGYNELGEQLYEGTGSRIDCWGN